MPATPTPARPFRLLLRIPVPWVYVLGYVLGLGLQTLLPARSIAAGAQLAIKLTGGVIFLAGALIAGWPLLLFHRAGTTTTPGESSRALVIRGPYRFTRNPMYVGLALAYLGEMGLLVQPGPLLSLLLVLAYVDRIVIPLEEATLAQVFGQPYQDYRARVRRWI